MRKLWYQFLTVNAECRLPPLFFLHLLSPAFPPSSFLPFSSLHIINLKNKMTPRRSARIANKLTAAGSNQAYADPPRLGKRKTRGSNDDENPRAKKKAPIKKAKSKKVQDQTKTPDVVNDEQQPVSPAPKDALASLPTEIQIQILSNVCKQIFHRYS